MGAHLTHNGNSDAFAAKVSAAAITPVGGATEPLSLLPLLTFLFRYGRILPVNVVFIRRHFPQASSRGDETVTTRVGLRQRVITILDALPEETQTEVSVFLDYLQYKLERPRVDRVVPSSRQTPYEPVALGGVWAGITITDEDIAQVRREMWGDFGEREL